MKKHEAEYEYTRLENTIKVIEEQLEREKRKLEISVDYARQLQMELTDHVSAVPTDLGSLTELWQYQTFMEAMEREYKVIKDRIDRLSRLINSPYFARIDFREASAAKAEKIYIGLSNLTGSNQQEILVYDWRAPISSLFYDYETGEAEYESPSGPVKGELTLKRQFKIVDRKIIYMFDSSLKIDDEILQEILSQSADEKMKTIVATIQREQNKVIRNDSNKVLIVHGPAGSGKTSIALHRAAYLLYKYRDFIKAENILILSPNKIFSSYISNVLPDLGEENIKEETFYGYFSKYTPGLMVESVYEQTDYILKNRQDEKRIINIKYKTSREFLEQLDKYIEELQSGESSHFRDIYYKDQLIMSREEMKQIFKEDRILPFKNRLEILRQRINRYLGVYEKQRLSEIKQQLLEQDAYMSSLEISRKSRAMLEEEFAGIKALIEEICSVDCQSLYEKIAGPMYKEGDYYLYEDWVALVYMQVMLGYIPRDTAIKHLIIDEAQDYTLMQYKILEKVFCDANVTILGDINQAVNYYMNIRNYDDIAWAYQGQNTVKVMLRKSYRSTRQIATFCKNIVMTPIDAEYFNREGKMPRIYNINDQESLYDAIAADVENLRKEGLQSLAVICRTAAQSRNLYYGLKKRMDVSLVTKDDASFSKGVLVMPSYLAKGLEFDAVLVPVEKDDYYPEEERKLFYTVCTRAMHQLHLYLMDAAIAPECQQWLEKVS